MHHLSVIYALEYSECGCKVYEGVHKDENPADRKCDDCGKYYSDADGKNEITLESTVVPATVHSYEWGVFTECGSDDPDANIIIKVVRYCINWLSEFVESCVVWLKGTPISILYWFIGIFTGDTKIF